MPTPSHTECQADSSRWLIATRGLSLAAKGLLADLQALRGSGRDPLPADPSRLARRLGLNPRSVRALLPCLFATRLVYERHGKLVVMSQIEQATPKPVRAEFAPNDPETQDKSTTCAQLDGGTGGSFAPNSRRIRAEFAPNGSETEAKSTTCAKLEKPMAEPKFSVFPQTPIQPEFGSNVVKIPTKSTPCDKNPSRARTRGLVNPITNNLSLFQMEESFERGVWGENFCDFSDMMPSQPRPPQSEPMQVLAAFEAYNAAALRAGLPQAKALTPGRRQRIAARMREGAAALKITGLEAWQQALAAVERSAFLCGQNDRGWRADLDFLCQAKSFGRLLDGSYGNGRHAGPSESRESRAAAARELAALDAALERRRP